MSLSAGPVIEIPDYGSRTVEASVLARGAPGASPEKQLASLGHQFQRANRGLLRDFGVDCEVGFSSGQVVLRFQAGSTVGALPLLSPTTGRPDLGLVIRPRFGWSGIGSVLGTAGWKVVPELLRLPLLPKSEKKVPPWVLSLTLLPRIEALLQRLDREFGYREEDTSAPKGQVRWSEYAQKRVGAFRMLDIPCRFPDLRQNEELKSAIHYTLLQHLRSLQTQAGSGAVVVRLIEYCEGLLRKVTGYAPSRPSGLFFERWSRTPLQSDYFREGLQAMQWSVDERGLAGPGGMEGLPWRMPMEAFFEGWVETICARLASLTGGVLKSGRRRETVAPLSWEPSFVGTQRSLVPDLVIEREDRVILLDAKYKYHWEELEHKSWKTVGEELRESHRHDLHQVLAYSTLFTGKTLQACLVYPCRAETWQSLQRRGRLAHHATVGQGERQIRLTLTAVPMSGSVDEIVQILGGQILDLGIGIHN